MDGYPVNIPEPTVVFDLERTQKAKCAECWMSLFKPVVQGNTGMRGDEDPILRMRGRH